MLPARTASVRPRPRRTPDTPPDTCVSAYADNAALRHGRCTAEVTATLALGADTHAVSLSLNEETNRMASRRTPASTSKPPSRTKTSAPAAPAQPVTVPPTVTAEAASTARKKAAPRAKRVPVSRPAITPDMRRGMIAESAYLRAERRGFAPGHEDEDWMAAEAEVDQLLSADQRAPQ